jgi:AcrR family transcriptional regulator
MAYFINAVACARHARGGRTIPATRQQSDNARRRHERRNADRRASGERWQTILKGAAEVFRREGFARARLEDVAAEVGINRASLYYYVGTKEELLVALIEQPAYTMTRHCREALDSGAPADEKLRRALRAYIEDMTDSPEIFLLFSESQHLATISEAKDIVANADAYGKALLAIVEEGIASGVFRRDLDPRLVMLGILGMHNWIHRWYVPGGRNTLTEIGDAFAEMTLAGLRP